MIQVVTRILTRAKPPSRGLYSVRVVSFLRCLAVSCKQLTGAHARARSSIPLTNDQHTVVLYFMALTTRLQEMVLEKKRAALLSVGSATLLLCLKTFLVLRTGSLGILSEALHSGLDLVAALITFLSVRVADQPADERHPYGHGKFENFSAFLETGLLVLTALYIIYEAFYRLFFHSVHIQPSLAAILILFAALPSTSLAPTPQQSRKEASKRSAGSRCSSFLHGCVEHHCRILGVLLVWAGNTWNVPALAYADAIAALCVAAVILWLSSQLGRRTLDALLDAAPAGRNRKSLTPSEIWTASFECNASACAAQGIGISSMPPFRFRALRISKVSTP